MAARTTATFAKRQKERARQEKQQEKMQRRLQRQQEKRESPSGVQFGTSDATLEDGSAWEPGLTTDSAETETTATERIETEKEIQ